MQFLSNPISVQVNIPESTALLVIELGVEESLSPDINHEYSKLLHILYSTLPVGLVFVQEGVGHELDGQVHPVGGNSQGSGFSPTFDCQEGVAQLQSNVLTMVECHQHILWF